MGAEISREILLNGGGKAVIATSVERAYKAGVECEQDMARSVVCAGSVSPDIMRRCRGFKGISGICRLELLACKASIVTDLNKVSKEKCL